MVMIIGVNIIRSALPDEFFVALVILVFQVDEMPLKIILVSIYMLLNNSTVAFVLNSCEVSALMQRLHPLLKSNSR